MIDQSMCIALNNLITSILSQCLWNDEHGVGVGLQAEPRLALQLVEPLPDGQVHGDLVGARPGHHAPVLQRVLDGAQAVADSVLGKIRGASLREIGPQNQKSRKCLIQ